MSVAEKDFQIKGSDLKKTQKLTLDNRSKLYLTGVNDVDSFSESSVVADTSMGKLLIKGELLKISKINIEDGELVLDGKVNTMEYSKKKEKVGFFESIFK